MYGANNEIYYWFEERNMDKLRLCHKCILMDWRTM
jgi:hypothetical protein